MKKRILIPEELNNSSVGSFFQAIGLVLESQITDENKDDILFIINDYCPENLTLPRIKIDQNLDFISEIENQVFASINKDNIQNPTVQILVKSFMTQPNFDLIESYSKDFKKATVIKIHEYLNIGYFIDSIVVEAYREGHDFDAIRGYLNQLFEYAFRQIEGKNLSPILDVIYSFSENVFAIEVSLQSKTFKKSDFFASKSKLLNSYTKLSNYFHVNYFSKRNRLTFSSAWFHDPTLKNFKSYFFSHWESKDGTAEYDLPVESGLEEKTEKTFYYPRKKSEEDLQSAKLTLSRKFAVFIKNYRKNESYPVDVDDLTIADIDRYLTYYPRQEALQDVDDEIKSFVLKLLKDEGLFDGITNYIQQASNSNLDPKIENFKNLIAGKSLLDIDEIIRINGNPENLKEKNAAVSDWKEENDNSDVRIKNITDNMSDEEKWELKKSAIVEKIQEEITRIKSNGGNIIQDDIIRVVSHELNLSDETTSIIVREIVAEAVSSELTQNNKIEEVVALKINQNQSEQVPSHIDSHKYEVKMLRMSKVMQQMKNEIIKLRQEKTAPNEDISSMSSEIVGALMIKQELEAAQEKNKLFQQEVELLKSENAKALESKDFKLQILEAQIEHLKEESPQINNSVYEEKIENLEDENKTLTFKLELATQKIGILNGNIVKNEGDAVSKKDKELEILKTNMQFAQSLIEKLKQERVDLQNKLSEEKARSKKSDDDKLKQPSSSKADIENELTNLKSQLEKKGLEEKYKAQSMELKRMEQKLKFALAQLDESQKGKGGSGATGNKKGNEVYIKQLENASARVLEATIDANEKKKEVIKLKQDNANLSTKIAELEKKLSFYEKRAS